MSGTQVQVTQVSATVWGYSTTLTMQLTQIGVETWISANAYTLVYDSGLIRETLYSYPGALHSSGLVRETLRSTLVGVAHTPGTVYTYPISGTRAGLSSIVAETSTRSYVVANSAVLKESLPQLSVMNLTDTVASADVFFIPGPTVALVDNATSSDVLAGSISFSASLTDSASSSDYFTFPINYPAVLPTDTAASSDTFAARIAYTFSWLDTVVSSDTFYPQNYFTRALADTVHSVDQWTAVLLTGVQLECGPIPIWPTLPESFPSKLSVVMDTTIGTTKSLREMRVSQQAYPLWDIELSYEELRDQTQNQLPYTPFAGINQYEQLTQMFLMMYGRTGVFAYRAPWDYSRTDQVIATGTDGKQTAFPVFESWGTPSVSTVFPIGMINNVINVKVNGTIVDPGTYVVTRSYINFNTPPPAGATITSTLTFYYLCRFSEDEQDFDEWEKNRWMIQSLKVRAVYWPGCQ